ncbi:MAG: hypothetical protein ACW99A_15655 [Candidatus Kariarchaeaceae archaeon]|jgi:hypothetical protein
MDHLVYLDKKSQEFQKIREGTKSMIIRGAAGRKMPYGRVHPKDILFFINNDGSSKLIGKATVTNVFDSDKMTKEESIALVNKNKLYLNLTPQQHRRWGGKRYLSLISFDIFHELEGIPIDRSNYSNMDDWIPLESINEIIVE